MDICEIVKKLETVSNKIRASEASLSKPIDDWNKVLFGADIACKSMSVYKLNVDGTHYTIGYMSLKGKPQLTYTLPIVDSIYPLSEASGEVKKAAIDNMKQILAALLKMSEKALKRLEKP